MLAGLGGEWAKERHRILKDSYSEEAAPGGDFVVF